MGVCVYVRDLRSKHFTQNSMNKCNSDAITVYIYITVRPLKLSVVTFLELNLECGLKKPKYVPKHWNLISANPQQGEMNNTLGLAASKPPACISPSRAAFAFRLALCPLYSTKTFIQHCIHLHYILICS